MKKAADIDRAEKTEEAAMNQMDYQSLKNMLYACADKIIRNELYLAKIDGAIGDGDHGIGMKNGMIAVRKVLDQESDGSDIYALFSKTGQAMENTMGGASSMIFSSMFSGNAKNQPPASCLSPEMLYEHFRSGLESVQRIGHAKEGDKTMVDALAPAVRAMSEHMGSFEELLKAAKKASLEGLEKTKEYVAKYGRAKNLGERAKGHQDAGATSVWLLFTAMADFVTGNETPDPVIEKKEEAVRADVESKKKIINRPEDVVKEESEGFLYAYGKSIKAVPGVNGLVKKVIPEGKTALLVGGGSGHEPMFGFFIGENLADCAANGNVFAAPHPETICKVSEAADRGAGVLFLYGNYTGDNLNFDKAAEILAAKGIQTKTVRVWDDIASAPAERITDRRGIAGDVLMIKIAGAACSELSLEEAFRVTEKARDNLYSIGIGLEGATIPGQKEPIFTLPEDEMEYGLGIHGEPGIKRIKMQSADEICTSLFSRIVEEGNLKKGDVICTYVNGLGSTTLMELMILNRKLAMLCEEAGLVVHDMDVNSLVTTMEMAGASISVLKIDDELKKYYDMPCSSPYYTKSRISD